VERCAVIPQFPVLFDEHGQPWTEGHTVSWSAYPDFLAVDFRNRQAQVQVVEVTKALKPKDLAKNLTAHRGRIERYIHWFMNDTLPICWRYFVRDVNKARLETQLGIIGKSEELKWKVIALEDVFDHLKRIMP
jgi:hypothetical protein